MWLTMVYSPFSERVGLHPQNAPFPEVLMKSIGAELLRSDDLPGVNHMRGMQCQIVLNTVLCWGSSFVGIFPENVDE